MCLVHEGVDGIREEERDGDHVEILESNSIVFLGLLFGIRKDVLVLEGNPIGDKGALGSGPDPNIDNPGDFP
jgi:hypothetical protein